MQFTAHNVALPDGTQTIPGEPLLADQGFCRAPLRTLNALWSPQERAQVRVADLGCLEGGYAVEFARHGYQSVGIEVRAANIEKCRWLANRLQLPNLTFIHDDVRNIEQHGTFDAIFCAGLLYHLDQPASFLTLLGRITSRLLMLQTHYAMGDWHAAASGERSWYDRLAPLLPERVRQALARRLLPRPMVQYKLSPLAQHEGRWGRWYGDYAPTATPTEIEKDLWASYGNPRSFWLHKTELLDVIRQAGFETLYEQYDFLDNLREDTYISDFDRSLFIGLKPRSA